MVEEKISLSERFGLWLSFYPPKQDEYLAHRRPLAGALGCSAEDIAAARGDALVWALERGSRSGRVAWRCARLGWQARQAVRGRRGPQALSGAARWSPRTG